MVLPKSVVEVSARSMPRMFAELGSDSSGIGIMAISGDPIRSDAGHCRGRSKECPGGSKVTMLAQHAVNQSAFAIDRPIQIPPSATHPNTCLVNVSEIESRTQPMQVPTAAVETAQKQAVYLANNVGESMLRA
jgi:hypothetical protein